MYVYLAASSINQSKRSLDDLLNWLQQSRKDGKELPQTWKFQEKNEDVDKLDQD
jgi:hypothetical protein